MFRMRCLRYTKRTEAFLAAAAFFAATAMLGACAHPYRTLRPFTGNPACLRAFQPDYNGVVYRTEVDVVGKHLGGLLILKTMPDSSTRIVFTSEMGLTFFDFAFSKDGAFKVYHIIKQMDKKPVIKTLRKDFELILWEHTDPVHLRMLTNGKEFYYGFPQEKGINYYITDSACTRLVRAEKSSSRKPFVTAEWPGFAGGTPDSVLIRHTQFSFTIALKRLAQ